MRDKNKKSCTRQGVNQQFSKIVQLTKLPSCLSFELRKRFKKTLKPKTASWIKFGDFRINHKSALKEQFVLVRRL